MSLVKIFGEFKQGDEFKILNFKCQMDNKLKVQSSKFKVQS